ncbi:xanthine dehydrogenase family protein molybdopterin-binding subunit [Actibacterium ureilyticum]|uniref:xanthine dehydrogenase family protein molybdopterin-binding subunit n=1 Tax=Actibacterium ureilyticum TaxID=1590614 RepID=UPI000BAB14D9|nr:molybdopterin cofactor-binding domain-containing protein [Actibacterium ureilyticum]
MSRAGTIARRSFLIGSAALLGGVAFGVYAAKRPFANPNLTGVSDGAVSFNPWVIVTPEKVVLIAPHGDKGQGIFSAQAALIAEELDIDPARAEVSFGVPDRAYYNRVIADAAVPIKSIDTGATAELLRDVMGGVAKLLLPMQITGGSTAIPDSYDKLRRAGAVARETLKRAAANRTGVAVGDLRSENGAVILPDGSTIPYTDLASDAARIEPVTDVTLRDPSEWRLLGKPMQRLDIVAKSTGTQAYGLDHALDGMLHATVRTNPRQGGELLGFDASAAKAMRGVHKVLEIPGGIAVVADNTWRAFQAAEAVNCDWGLAPYPAEQVDHWAEIEQSFTDDRLNAKPRDDGDVDTAEGAELRAEYRAPYVAHAPLEPLNATILVTDTRADIWTGHQIPGFAAQFVADITGIDRENVHLHNQFMGGSFGHRLEFDVIRQAAEIGRQMRGTPIKLTYRREEDVAHDYPRHITMGRGRGKTANGRVVALDLQLAAPSVIASQMGRMGLSVPGPDAQLHEGAWDNPYGNLAHQRVRSYRVPELAPVSSWRSVGAAPNGFIFDTLLDELIHQAGADPLEERLRLMDHDVSRKVLEAVGEMSSWGSPLPAGSGRGVAFVISFGVPVAEVVEVTQTESGIRLDKAWIAADVGRVIDPVNLQNLAQGGMIFGLGHAMNCEITYADGMAEQSNYDSHAGMRLYQCPTIEFRALENGPKIRGFGEPPVPPAAPALGNAIFAATGQRIRELPFNRHIDFV